jgi:hypothetical protein
MSVQCECGKILKNKNSYYAHRSKACKALPKNTGTYTCPFCQKEYSHQDNCIRHMKTCPNKPASLTDDPKPIPSIIAITQLPPVPVIPSTVQENSNNSSTQVRQINSNNTTTTTTNSNNVNSNNTVTQHINYFINLSNDVMTDHFLTKFGPNYIKQGEEGLYQFIYWEVFTDPSNPTNTAIRCTNHKMHRFIY